jgi:hypothetical protein
MLPLIATGLIIVACCALYGWGSFVRRVTALPAGTWPVTITLGLASWIFLGGVLNLFRIANIVVLNTTILLGLGFAIQHWRALRIDNHWQSWWPKATTERVYRLMWYGLIVAIMGVTLITQVKPSIYNHHDDLQKYFAHPVRMVQTGTLYGSPLNALGSDTLGGQALLQALVVGNFPIAYINAADAVFCLLLIILMAGGVAVQRPTVAPVAAITVLMIAIINPQYVNVSALYSGAALILAVVLISTDPREYLLGKKGYHSPSSSITGLLYAALLSLKATFAIFVVFHFLCCTAASAIATRRLSNELRLALHTVFWTLAFLSPWIACYAPFYAGALMHPVPFFTIERPIRAQETIDLFSTTPLDYGGSFAQYSWLAATIFICGVAPVFIRRSWMDANAARLAGTCVAVAIGYPVMVIVFGPLLMGGEINLRYYLPVLIGTAPAALSVCALLINPLDQGQRSGRIKYFLAFLAAMIVIWFLPSAYQRARLLHNSGSMLAYLQWWSPTDIEQAVRFDQNAFDRSERQRWSAVQQFVPPGEPLLAWIAEPFALDFARNPIIDVDLSGLGTPWTRMPKVSYVLWQFKGYGVRQPSDYDYASEIWVGREAFIDARGYQFVRYLMDLHAASKMILFEDEQTVLFKITHSPSFP